MSAQPFRWFDPSLSIRVQAKATPSPPPQSGPTLATLATLAGVGSENAVSALRDDEAGERAAIVEYEAGVPRDWAEAVARVYTMPAPAGVPERRWDAAKDAAGRLLDRWAATAALLGWGPLDLFGADPERPLARVDRMGLCWLIGKGDEVIALADDGARIRTRSGALLRYVKSNNSGAVPLWQLSTGV
jgi:hypothetical protein